jgi:hypothetical protein
VDSGLSLRDLKNEAIRKMREEGLLRPRLVRPGEKKLETNAPEQVNPTDHPGNPLFKCNCLKIFQPASSLCAHTEVIPKFVTINQSQSFSEY